jgi:hypothetical protein
MENMKSRSKKRGEIVHLKEQTTIRVPQNEMKLVREFSHKEGIKPSDYMGYAIHEYNEKKKKEFSWKASRNA